MLKFDYTERMWGERKLLSSLIGKKIFGISISPDATILCFDTDCGPEVYLATSHQCTQSWFNDVIGVKVLIGHTVTDVAAADWDEVMPPDVSVSADGDVLRLIYGLTLATEAGRADIIFRNDDWNDAAYYGGNIEHVVFDSITDECLVMKNLLDDWSNDEVGEDI
jgi:hypothetical protein